MILREFEFTCGAQHAKALDPAQFANLDQKRLAILAWWQFRANQGTGYLDTHAGIGCPADDGQQISPANIDLANPQPISVGMLYRLPDFANHNVAKGCLLYTSRCV